LKKQIYWGDLEDPCRTHGTPQGTILWSRNLLRTQKLSPATRKGGWEPTWAPSHINTWPSAKVDFLQKIINLFTKRLITFEPGGLFQYLKKF